MSSQILATKVYIPPPRPAGVPRSGLIARMNEGLRRKLTLISAPAGFGKTTLVGEWLQSVERRAQSVEQLHDAPTLRSTFSAPRSAWLSIDEGDSDPSRFLAYLIAALQTIAPHISAAEAEILKSPQPPRIESLLTSLLNHRRCYPPGRAGWRRGSHAGKCAVLRNTAARGAAHH
ncbi:MAG TPA: hypothetical protein VFU22_27785 [Roseiflexaceae bacterium]|nr:hypothetical protein [Roseiflexaceae bacterium]